MLNLDWKDKRSLFNEHLSKVLEGWTEKQLLEYAGSPDNILVNEWYYQWRASDGMYSYYIFNIKDGVIVNIKSASGSIYTM